MNAQIVDLAKWREEHPPLVRLAHIQRHLFSASLRLQRNSWRAWLSLFIVKR